jgi:hypothetical protein
LFDYGRGKRVVLVRSAVGVLNILLSQGFGAADSRRRNFEIGLSVQEFYSATVVENVSRLNVQTIKAKSSQPNNSLNLPARRARARFVETGSSSKVCVFKTKTE